MTNISHQKREKMLEFLNKLKQEHQDDESLRAIGEIESALNEKKYGLVWEKHREKVDEMLEHNIPVFCEDERKKILTNENDGYNFLLEGDNLHSLKLLEKIHKGKIDVIYIDPPYNTGNKDFIYNDSFVEKTDGYSHSKWLSFMSERLEIARDLLSEEGIIFISIDDNEQAQLKLLCDEVFGENNFVADFIRKTGSTRAMAKHFDVRHEYVLIYSKNIINLNLNKLENKKVDKYLNLDNDNAGTWSTEDLTVRKGGYEYEIPSIDLKNKFKKKWRYDIKTMKEKMGGNENLSFEEIYKNANKIENGWYILDKIVFKKIDGIPSNKKYSSKTRYITNNTLYDFVGSSKSASKLLKDIIGENVFDNPKPIELLNYLLKIGSKKSSTILDFFAGSGTTGHAVMQLNKEDGGNRKYILCTNNENNICEEVTYQRLKNIQADLPHNLKYFRTDFISKYESDEDEETISEKMLEHIKELIELEHHIEIDNSKYIILDNEDELENVVENIKEGGKLFITSGIFLSRTHQRILDDKNVTVVDIPEYYYRSELKEVGEL